MAGCEWKVEQPRSCSVHKADVSGGLQYTPEQIEYRASEVKSLVAKWEHGVKVQFHLPCSYLDFVQKMWPKLKVYLSTSESRLKKCLFPAQNISIKQVSS